MANTEATTDFYIINFSELKSVKDIEKACHDIQQEEAKTAKQMDALMSQHVHLEAKIISLHKMLPNLQLVGTDAEQLSSMITFTSTLAENISSKVKRLDVAKSHVSECLQRVEDILDLKFCTDGVQSALQNEDYEQAAAHIHRFLGLDQSVLRRSAADSKEGSSLDEAFAQLHDAENKLKLIVMQRFDEAVRDEDIASVERFFKIFPLLNQHAEGLKKFSIYLSSQIADTAQKNLKMAQSIPVGDKRNNIIYADTMTLLFEGIARVVEIHQPLVETYYGPGKLQIVIDLLQKVCDRQSKKILDEFKSCRKLDEKVKLVQQVMINPNKNPERLDPRELDILLGEMTLLNTRTELYIRFIRRRVMGDIETANQEEDKRQEGIRQLEKTIKDCELSKSMQELLGQYIMMEEYFLRESVHKAINMDQIEDNSLTSSMLDDVYYILKKCVRRSLASSSVDGICAMVNHAATLLDTVFYEILDERLQQGPSGMIDLTQAYNMLQTTFQHGIYHVSTETSEKSKALFLSSLNNVEVACEYTVTLRKNLEDEIQKNLGQLPPQQQAKLESCLSSLTSVTTNFKKLLEPGLKQLCKTVVEPRIKTWIDAFLAANHEITDDEFCQYESNDGMRPFVQTFLVNLDLLLKSLKASLTPNNCDMLIGLLVSDLTMQLEQAILKCCLNRLGGLQFDKELRSIITYLTSVTTWTIRDKFARLTQIATILNLEMVSEILDFWGPNSGSLTWRLTPTEVREVLKLRIDFKTEDIKRLKL